MPTYVYMRYEPEEGFWVNHAPAVGKAGGGPCPHGQVVFRYKIFMSQLIYEYSYTTLSVKLKSEMNIY
jgi:hypothetical protein